MNVTELQTYLLTYTKPSLLDIEMAERAILEALSSSPLCEMPYVEVSALSSQVYNRLGIEKWPVPAEFHEVQPDPNRVKTEFATREALQRLHGSGSLVAFGMARTQSEGIDEARFSVRHAHGGGPAGDVFLPTVYRAYHLATPFRNAERTRLASADVYLSHLDQAHLPSRAKRCLRESVEAFKKGLYLSATISVGAASESLWMSFGRLLLDKKLPGYLQLEKAFKNAYPNAGEVLKATWDILRSECSNELKQIFLTRGEQDAFKSYADSVLELRNYAIHSEDADEDEPRFTYDETGLLLLRAATYFNKLMSLLEAVEKKP